RIVLEGGGCVNHIQEGTILKEWRLQFLNHNNPVQLRCVACNDFCDNLHKLQSHVATFRHKCCSRALQKVRLADVALDSTLKDSQTNAGNCDDQLSPSRILYCVLCRFIAPDKKRMLGKKFYFFFDYCLLFYFLIIIIIE
ncbi:hypothetical protein D917_03978, partial [Trichinella nativa]